jgi:putative ABC transport system substrate-binding protein
LTQAIKFLGFPPDKKNDVAKLNRPGQGQQHETRGGHNPLTTNGIIYLFRRAGYFLCLFLGVLCLSEKSSTQDLNLAIVYSDSLTSTMRTMRGIRSSISRQYETAAFDEYLLVPEKAKIDKCLNKIKKSNHRLIITVGSFATEEVVREIKDKPVIFSAVLNPVTSGFVESMSHPGGNATGASLDIPPDIQYKYFKRVIKDLKKIGVLYTDETANLIPPAKAVASSVGLELIAVKINSEKDIPEALDHLNQTTDGIWSVADPKIFSPRSTRYIVLNALRNGKPFMGFSRNLVASGALFALDFDYKDIGRQTGKIAIEVLSGRPPASISVAVPGIIWFHYNEKTAQHINISIPEDLVAIAKEVYR